ncbi:MAG: phosphatidate cytidylyltransferase [Pseudomonadota bacterium]
MLRQRIVTALIALGVLLLVMFVLPENAARAFIGLLVLGGAWEWSVFLGSSKASVRVFFVLLVAALVLLSGLLLPQVAEIILLASLVWWLLALIWAFRFPTPVPVALRWLGGLFVLLPVFVALALLYSADPVTLLFALIVVWAADVGAYFTGKRFGRVKLAAQISPGKTWEGVLGGLIVVSLVAIAFAAYRDLSYAVLVPFCMAAAALSIVGDLTVSMFKRSAGVKDSGTLFPGHGGILDRIDSVSAAAPLFALGLAWTGLG